MARILSKMLTILLCVILLVSAFAKNIYAVAQSTQNNIYVEKKGKIDEHLKYYSKQYKEYRYLKCNVWESNSNIIYTMEESLQNKYGYYVEKENLLNDDEIWRIIKNGYPYKSEKELGLNSKYDAYAVTRWAMACSLGKMDINLFKAEDNDITSKEMLRVLKQLVYIGKNGTEKLDDTLFSIIEGKVVGIDIKNYLIEIKLRKDVNIDISLDKENSNKGILANLGCGLKTENENSEKILDKGRDDNKIRKDNKTVKHQSKLQSKNEVKGQIYKKGKEQSNLQNKNEIKKQNSKVDKKEEKQEPKVYIENNGLDEVDIGQDVENDISIRNVGNTDLEKLVWKYKVPIKYVKLKKFYTGTYNQNVVYNLFYKTNLSDEYKLIMEGVPSNENFEIDFEQELSDNEYVTEIKVEFEKVDDRFCSNENPHFFSNVLQDIKSEAKFVSIASIKGILKNHEVTDESKCETMFCKMLPKTGS